MGHIVTAALVVARTDSGGDVYVYGGRHLPGNVKAEERKRLVDAGLVQVVAEPKPAEEPNRPKSVEDMTGEELRAHAREHEYDLGGATAKADILAAVQTAAQQATQA